MKLGRSSRRPDLFYESSRGGPNLFWPSVAFGKFGATMTGVYRIERHDVMNALGLAAILLAMALALLFGARTLFRTVNDGIVDSSKEPVVTVTSTTELVTTSVTEATTTTATLHLPAEITTRVGNGAQRGGVAGAGKAILAEAGYISLSPKNAPPTPASVIYYVEGFAADAANVARLLGLPETAIALMPADPGIPQGDAQIVAILGRDTSVG